MVRQFYIYIGLCADFKSIRIYLFNALDMIKVFPLANVHAPGHLKGGQLAGQYQTDFAIDLWYDDDNNEKWIRNFE